MMKSMRVRYSAKSPLPAGAGFALQPIDKIDDGIEAAPGAASDAGPIQTMTLVSAADAALRARRRQYEAARYLIEREQAADRLEELVRERTRQLQEANDQLVAARDSLKMALDAAQMITWDLDLGEYRNGRAPIRDRLPEYNSLLQSWSRAIAKEHILPDGRELFETASGRLWTPAVSGSNAGWCGPMTVFTGL